MHHVIIGNSAAGVSAAETLRKVDPSCYITMISEEKESAYSRCMLPDLLAGSVPEDRLRIRPKDFYETNQIHTIFGKRAEAVIPSQKMVRLSNGSCVSYDRLLIATGSSSAMPPIPGLQGENVFGLRHLSDVRGILAAVESARRVLVVGGGFVGLEAAYALYERGYEVTVVEKLPQILPQQLDRRAAAILQNDMQGEGIRFILGRGIQEVLPPTLWQKLFRKKGQGILLDNGQELKAEVIIVATGTRANTDVVKNTDMVLNRGIPVDDFMETSIPDIYAAGDVAETMDIVTGEVGLTPIWPNAGAQGQIAAYNMAGQNRAYGGLIGMQNAVEFRKIPAMAMGITQPNSSEYTELIDYAPERNFYKKLVTKENRLVGMILVGDIQQAGIYGALIKNKADIAPYRNQIMSPNFSYAHMVTHSGTQN